MQVFNLTLHDQGQYESEYKALGLRFVPDAGPHGFDVPVGADRAWIHTRVQQALDAALAADARLILVGGLSSVAIAVALEIAEVRSRIPGIGSGSYACLGVIEAVTERVRDENDRFVFRLSGARTVLPAHRTFAERDENQDLGPFIEPFLRVPQAW